MEQLAAGVFGFHRCATGSPPVREAGNSAGAGHHRPGSHRHLEAIVH
jgi:hypothetical protein